jgi:hypothetical protein
MEPGSFGVVTATFDPDSLPIGEVVQMTAGDFDGHSDELHVLRTGGYWFADDPEIRVRPLVAGDSFTVTVE